MNLETLHELYAGELEGLYQLAGLLQLTPQEAGAADKESTQLAVTAINFEPVHPAISA